jgi:acid stress chaperone HdeA
MAIRTPIFSTALIAIAFSPGLVGAAPLPEKPLSHLTCEEFNGVDETLKPRIVAWGAAYAQGHKKPEAVVVDIDATEKVTPFVVDECEKAPNESLWQKIKAGVKHVF